ncbi:MAG: hypothetical protein JNL96_19995 [Planctomycetaceae bacterium]|nr:hypothetical protein [Planctomycetaceae bacterium]
MTFSFGHSSQERIEIDVLGYERAPVGEYFDDNWLRCVIRVCAGGFRGEFDAAILTGELVAFLDQLRPLFATLRGSAELTTLEEQLHLLLIGDGKGHIDLDGNVVDAPGSDNRLHFRLQFDQTELGASICEFEKVAKAFPIRMA